MAHLTDTLEKFARQELALSELKRICLEIAQGDGPLSAEIRHELARLETLEPCVPANMRCSSFHWRAPCLQDLPQ